MYVYRRSSGDTWITSTRKRAYLAPYTGHENQDLQMRFAFNSVIKTLNTTVILPNKKMTGIQGTMITLHMPLQDPVR